MSATSAGKETDVRDLARILYRDLLPIGLLTLAGLGLALLYLTIAQPSYTASATLFIDPRTRKIVSEEVVPGGIATDNALVESQVSIIASDTVLRRVVDKLGLTSDPEYVPPPSTGLKEMLKTLIRGKRVQLDDVSQAVENLARKIKVKRAQRTYIVVLEVDASTATKAAAVANAITDAYLLDQSESKSEEAKRARTQIDARLDELREQVRLAETRVDEWKKANKIITSEGGMVGEQQLGKLNSELATARAVAAEAKARYEQTKAIARSGAGIEGLPDSGKSGLIQKLREQYAQVARREASLSAQLRDRHPVIIEVRSQLRELKAQIDAELKRIALGTRTEYEIAAKREREISATIDQAKAGISNTNTAQIKLRELEQEADASRELMRTFLVRAKETQEQEKLSATEARVISKAPVPSSPSKPSPWLVLALGLAGGLGLGIARSLLRDHLDPSVHTLADTRADPDLPSLGVIPPYHPETLTRRIARRIPGELGGVQAAHFSDLLSSIADASGRTAPAYRQGVLRLVQMIKAETPAKGPLTVMLVSADRGAGTSATALGAAYGAAQSGDRVLLVDACSPNPELSRMFSGPLKRDEVVVLDNKEHLARITTHDARSGLTLLPIAMADLRALKGPQRRRLAAGITALAEDYDLVVIDGGALLEDEAVLGLVPATDRVILVARAHATRPTALATARETLLASGATLQGTVLTMATERAL